MESKLCQQYQQYHIWRRLGVEEGTAANSVGASAA